MVPASPSCASSGSRPVRTTPPAFPPMMSSAAWRASIRPSLTPPPLSSNKFRYHNNLFPSNNLRRLNSHREVRSTAYNRSMGEIASRWRRASLVYQPINPSSNRNRFNILAISPLDGLSWPVSLPGNRSNQKAYPQDGIGGRGALPSRYVFARSVSCRRWNFATSTPILGRFAWLPRP
jgi:hypothetical protein